MTAFKLIWALIALTFLAILPAAKASAGEKVLVLCYHAVQAKPAPGDAYSISKTSFVEQMEYLATHGYSPVSLDDVIKASHGKKKLPPNPVLLTFDDGYVSYRTFIAPYLEKIGFPSVLAVVGSFPESAPDGLPEAVMSWEQIREVSKRKLVEVVSHTYDMHKGVVYNPQGNTAPAARAPAYDASTGRYETEKEYVSRLDRDFQAQNAAFQKNLGFKPRALAWPYGKYTRLGLEAAARAGYAVTLTLDEGYADTSKIIAMNRVLIYNEPIEEFIKKVKNPVEDDFPLRAVQIDLDLVYDAKSKERTRANLDRLFDRVIEMGVNTVFLQAFADPEGTGNIESVYFQNRVLPMRADLFSYAAHQLYVRGIAVYAWMPTLGVVLKDANMNRKLRVMESAEGKTTVSTSWYRRLTPFSRKSREMVRKLYEDLAAHTQIEGVLFQDDAYLAENEDYHPEALKAYRERFGEDLPRGSLEENAEVKARWTRFKTEALIDFTDELKEGVRKYRPTTRFIRNLYAPAVIEPESEGWFAQNYQLSLKSYDFVAVMAYVRMEEAEDPSEWLKGLVETAEKNGGIEKTVFKLQAFDWKNETWVDSDELVGQMREILAAGGRHLAYYPDDYTVDRPALKKVRLEISSKIFPFPLGQR